jgi:hypothetical protein
VYFIPGLSHFQRKLTQAARGSRHIGPIPCRALSVQFEFAGLGSLKKRLACRFRFLQFFLAGSPSRPLVTSFYLMDLPTLGSQ